MVSALIRAPGTFWQQMVQLIGGLWRPSFS
jgi:hypothetical protein